MAPFASSPPSTSSLRSDTSSSSATCSSPTRPSLKQQHQKRPLLASLLTKKKKVHFATTEQNFAGASYDNSFEESQDDDGLSLFFCRRDKRQRNKADYNFIDSNKSPNEYLDAFEGAQDQFFPTKQQQPRISRKFQKALVVGARKGFRGLERFSLDAPDRRKKICTIVRCVVRASKKQTTTGGRALLFSKRQEQQQQQQLAELCMSRTERDAKWSVFMGHVDKTVAFMVYNNSNAFLSRDFVIFERSLTARQSAKLLWRALYQERQQQEQRELQQCNNNSSNSNNSDKVDHNATTV